MSKTKTEHPIGSNRPGTRRFLQVHRYGTPGAHPKAYIQASLHADEIPAMLVAHHLLALLDAAAAQGGIAGEIIVVPCANPIGLDQFVDGVLLGRHDIGLEGNFNRGFPDLSAMAADDVADRLGDDAATNVEIIRTALLRAHGKPVARTELESLRMALLGYAIDADIVLDLHCDSEAVMHLYTAPALWPNAEDLAADIGAQAVLLAERSGGNPFDEACSSVWWTLAERFPHWPIPAACLAATVELRGRADVDDTLARQDAEALLRFLRRRGVVAGEPSTADASPCTATPLSGVDRVTAPCAGILVHRVALGRRVRKGEIVADIVDPMAPDTAQARHSLVSRTDGIVFARSAGRFVTANDVVCNIAGAAPLVEPGARLLTD